MIAGEIFLWYLKTMDGESHKKIAVSIFIVVLLLVGVLVGSLITRNVAQTQTTKTQASQNTVKAIEVLNPAPGQVLNGPTEVKARVINRTGKEKLNAVFIAGDSAGVPMKLEQQEDKLIMTGTLDPKNAAPGRQTLSIYLYKTENGTAELVGSSVFYIQI